MSNPTCADGFAYFSAEHGNSSTVSAALDETSLGVACAKMRKQKSLDGTNLAIPPKFLVVGPDLEVKAAKLLRDVGDQLPLELLVEPAIPASDYYVFADPARHPALVLGTLGDANPSLRSRAGFAVEAMEFQLFDSVGVGVGDPRAAVRTPGG